MKNDLNIRDEEILLLGLCRLSFGVELKVMLTALAETVTDWDYFFSVANAHGVAALVYHNLEKLGFLHLVPDKVAGNLRNAMMVSLSRNAGNAEAMGEVLRILNRENIKTVLLKGLALELTVYGNKGLRQMTDVDVLVSRDNCMKARKLLMENGFESLPVKSLFLKPIIADFGKHLPTLIKNGFAVEIHHELFGAGKNVLTRILYETSIELEVNGEKSFVPDAQIFFLYLVKHLYLHEMNNESQLRLYTDLVVLIDKYGDEILNYDLLTYANQAGMSQILAWRLEPLRDLWGISFAGWINEFIDKWYHPDSINRFVFFLKNPKDNPPPGKGLKFRNNFREVRGVHRKILFILGEIFPTIGFMKKRYNCKSTLMALLYYPARWFFLV
jgi:hypothetical protein